MQVPEAPESLILAFGLEKKEGGGIEHCGWIRTT